MMRRRTRPFVAGLLCAVLAAGSAHAQSDPAGDPPTRVGRLSEVEGVVSFHTADQTEWAPAAINYPVTGGSSFWTEPSARVALQVGPAIIRLASQTEFDVVALDDHNFQGQIDFDLRDNVREIQASAGLVPDGNPDAALLAIVRARVEKKQP